MTQTAIYINDPQFTASPRRRIPGIVPAVLTTDHPSSTHGLPVVVLEDGTAMGPAESGEVYVSQYVETDDVAGRDIYRQLEGAEQSLVDAARSAGYVVRAKITNR